MFSRSTIATLIPAVALTTAGFAATAPAQAATTTSVTAATAGTKAVGATTYLWGTSNAPVGTTVCSQVSLNANWSTSQCSTVKADHSYTVELSYGKTTPGTYTFRAVTRTASGAITATSAPVTLTRGSSTPVAPTKPSAPSKGSSVDYVKGRTTYGYVLAAKYNGVKVSLIQNALGIPYAPRTTMMGPATIAAVIKFQKAHAGLRTDGVVDAPTFYAIKDAAAPTAEIKNPKYNFDIDEWMAPAQVAAGATHQARVAAMIAFAEDQARPTPKPYIWGGTGPFGYDCSGLMLQALRAGGYQPKGVSNYTDVLPPSNLSSQMLADTKDFTKGSFNNLQLGDMIYYSDKNRYGNEVVDHVAMYVGGGRIINALDDVNGHNGYVTYDSAGGTQGHGAVAGVNRMPL